MFHRLIPFATCVLLAAPAGAAPFRAQNDVTVLPQGATFLVQDGAGQGARGMWCAAADYARRVLDARGFQRLYVAQARRPGLFAKGPVGFTLDPAGLTPSRVLIVGSSVHTPGATLSVDHAITFCADAHMRGG